MTTCELRAKSAICKYSIFQGIILAVSFATSAAYIIISPLFIKLFCAILVINCIITTIQGGVFTFRSKLRKADSSIRWKLCMNFVRSIVREHNVNVYYDKTAYTAGITPKNIQGELRIIVNPCIENALEHEQELEALTLHELAHARYKDYYANYVVMSTLIICCMSATLVNIIFYSPSTIVILLTATGWCAIKLLDILHSECIEFRADMFSVLKLGSVSNVKNMLIKLNQSHPDQKTNFWPNLIQFFFSTSEYSSPGHPNTERRVAKLDAMLLNLETQNERQGNGTKKESPDHL